MPRPKDLSTASATCPFPQKSGSLNWNVVDDPLSLHLKAVRPKQLMPSLFCMLFAKLLLSQIPVRSFRAMFLSE